MRIIDNKFTLWSHLYRFLFINGWVPVIIDYDGTYYEHNKDFWIYLGNYTGICITDKDKNIFIDICKWKNNSWKSIMRLNYKDEYLEERLMEYVEDERIYVIEWKIL